MASRRDRVLELIKHNGAAGITTRRIADLTDYPTESIRRNIQELRAAGHDIVYGNGFYRYWGMQGTAASASSVPVAGTTPAL